jgi:hypothetical protein
MVGSNTPGLIRFPINGPANAGLVVASPGPLGESLIARPRCCQLTEAAIVRPESAFSQ